MSQDPAKASFSQPPEKRSGHIDESPGVLRGSATLVLQSRQAQRLVKGRAYSAEKSAIIGLLGFANLVRALWHGARADDPYADWWLLRIHEAMLQTERELVTLEQGISSRFEMLGAIDVSAPVSTKPARIALNFSNPYAFRAARLISVFDALACKALSARHVGLIGRDESEKTLYQGGRWIRRALQSPVGYRLLGVTRDDVVQNTAKAIQAGEAMGVIPDDVVRGVRRAPHAPTVMKERPGTLTDAVGLRSMPGER